MPYRKVNKSFSENYFLGNKYPLIDSLGTYDLLIRLNLWRINKLKKLVLSYANNHKTLLDVGCAFGHFLHLLEPHLTTYGVDISDYAVRVAKQRVLSEIRKCDIQKSIPFKRTFDIITAIDILEHLNNPEKAIRNIYSCLNDNGYFFFQLPTVSNKISNYIYTLFFSQDNTHIFIKSLEEINDLLEDIGFKKITIYSSLLPIFFRKENLVRDFCLVFGVYKKL